MEKVRREKIRDGESLKREDAGARKGRKVAKHCVFSSFVAPEGEMKNCTPLWREAHFEVKSAKSCHVQTAFGS